MLVRAAAANRCPLTVTKHCLPPSFPAKTERRRFVTVRFCVLASGSSGNAAFLATSKTRILIDAGLSVRELARRLALIGESPEALDAVLVTHEHSDHVAGLARLVRWRERLKRHLPVYCSRLTAPLLNWEKSDGEKSHCENMELPPIERFQAGSGWMIGNIAVQSFTIPHDAIDPVGFCFHAEGVKLGIATDLGYVPDSIKIHLRRAQILLLESNHDLEMLKVGPYPWSVKQRVMGRNGHLSNAHTCDYLENDIDGGVQTLVLGHLSDQNNHPELVRLGAEQALVRRGISPRLVVAGQKSPTEVFTY
ncbi:MAG TPA: MBL fold metallo-hydrolase [Bryobacteraceae bacterium]|nr:MBL fold metallo-hydrolase [Bryobacteraceae bacterium]